MAKIVKKEKGGAYERDQGERGVELQEFFDSTAGKWRTDVGKSWAQVVTDERARRSS